MSPGDDLQQAVDGSAASGRATIVCLGAGEIRLRRFLAIARDVIVLRGEGAATILRLEDGPS